MQHMANFPRRVCSSGFCTEVYLLTFMILNARISLCREIHLRSICHISVMSLRENVDPYTCVKVRSECISLQNKIQAFRIVKDRHIGFSKTSQLVPIKDHKNLVWVACDFTDYSDYNFCCLQVVNSTVLDNANILIMHMVGEQQLW